MKKTRTKKTTVITTEKREIWIVRERPGPTQVPGEEPVAPNSAGESSPLVLNERPQDRDSSRDECHKE